MEAIRVLIVDDHPMVRRGLQSLLGNYPDIRVVGEAPDGASALRVAGQLSPDVILLDLNLPGPDGVEIAHQLYRVVPASKVIVLTAFDSDEYLMGALQAGVHAYVLKSTSDETVVDTIRAVFRGKRLLSPELMERVLDQFQGLAQGHARHRAGLSAMDVRVLELIAEGATNEEIAEGIFLSERSVKRLVAEVMEKLEARNRAEAVAQAMRRGLI